MSLIKRFIILIYQVMFNRQRQTGMGKNSRIIGSMATSLFLFVCCINFLAICEMLWRVRIDISQGKIANIIFFGFLVYLVELLLFKVYKIDSEPPNGIKFLVSDKSTRKIWTLFILNFVLLLTLPVLRNYYLGR